MKKLFLSSSFPEVFKLFSYFTREELNKKKVTFIATASIPESVKFNVSAGKKALEKLGLLIDELEISNARINEISKKLHDNDYIYIAGGNTFYLLQELKRTGTDKILREQINSGKIFIGESAGSVILAPHIEHLQDMDDHKKAPELKDFSALAIVNFYPLPHHTNFPFKKTVEKIISKFESRLRLIPFSNSQVIVVNGSTVTIMEKK